MKRSTPGFDPNLRRQIATLAAILGSIAVNTFSNFFPLNGVNIGKLSNTLLAPVQIIPANYAFAIWGLIYLGLIGFGIYQIQPSQRKNPLLQRSGYLLVLASVAQCAWIYLFLARLFALSVIAMLGILLPLIGIYQRLGIGEQRISRQDRWLIQIPISIYLGWITVATVVNVAIALYSFNWSGWSIAPTVWTVMMMLVSAAIAAFITLQRRDTAYTLVIVWALVAIAIRHLNTPLIAVTGGVLAIGLILLLFVTQFKSVNNRMIQSR
jgi:hypothetical protein